MIVRSASLHVCLVLPYLDQGGTESHVLTLAEALSSDRKHRVTLLAPPGTGEVLLADLVGRIHHIPFVRFDRAPWGAWRSYRRALRSLLDADPPSLIHVHGAHELIAALPGVARRLPVIFTNHGFHEPGKAASYRTSAWVCNRWAAAAIAVSGHERNLMLRYGFRSERVHLIHNGIRDPLEIENSLACGATGLQEPGDGGSPPIPEPQAITVGVVARLEKAKGIEWLVRAVARIVSAGGEIGQRIRCEIVGTGSEEQPLRALAQSLGVADRIHFAGFVPHAARAMRAFDLFVLPSIEEPFGLVCAEAMANALPVVASRTGGIPEVVEDGETGLLVPPADDEALAGAILRLAGDLELRRRMGQAGRRRFLQHFTVEAMVEKTVSLYERVLTARS